MKPKTYAEKLSEWIKQQKAEDRWGKIPKYPTGAFPSQRVDPKPETENIRDRFRLAQLLIRNM